MNHNVSFRVLVANFDSRLQHSFRMLDKIKSEFKDNLFDNMIHVNVKLKEAQNAGTHIFNYDKYCRGAKDYFSLGREIITQEKNSLQPLVRLEKMMEEVLKKELPKICEVVFSISAPSAKEVYIAGDFNAWRIDKESRMEQDNGVWRKQLNLNKGKYHYRFVIDGVWTEDNNNPSKETNPYGSVDSLLEVL